ncbi:WUSCHEL-related homeobox 11-like [Aristolochia californica]|uniref:WUSCHEL-related homeobox 11-like n=1 Tax=Aristolochia californica TaxID=171875 RepID=UPI0035DE8480
MEEEQAQATQSSNQSGERTEPVRSRWTPKPEQILILETIFNSGMVNPPKDETVRIRKLLERFGTVGDANVFYWFQNRRSRSRRRQRQIQAAKAADPHAVRPPAGVIRYDPTFPSATTANSLASPGSSSCYIPSPSAASGGVIGGDGSANELFSVPPQMDFSKIEQNPIVPSMMWAGDSSNLHYQPGLITVFINGAPSEVPRGPLDISMFGQDVMLVHSSGEPVPVNEFGISLQGLQFGENYFLVNSSFHNITLTQRTRRLFSGVILN